MFEIVVSWFAVLQFTGFIRILFVIYYGRQYALF